MQESSIIQINAWRKIVTSPLNKTFFKTNKFLCIYLFLCKDTLVQQKN